MRKNLMLGAAALTMLLGVGTAHAEGGYTVGDLSGRTSSGSSIGGAYVDATRLSIYNMNYSGSGANTSYGGSYSTAACCTFAPGGLPKGEEVNSLTLFEVGQGMGREGIPVVQEPPYFHWWYPNVRTYSLADLKDLF